MLVVIGVNKFKRKTEKQKALMKQRASDYVRKVARQVLRDLVLQTPQWSGNTAASWTIVTNKMNKATPFSDLYVADWENVETFFKGDKRALEVAYRANTAVIESLRWNSDIKIVNAAPMADELATDPNIEDQLRPGNYIPNDVMAIKTVTAKWKLSSTVEGVRLRETFAR